MPLYQANIRPGLLDFAGRSAFSIDVVEVTVVSQAPHHRSCT